MIRQTYAASLAGPAEYEYTKPVDCFVCGTEYDCDGHEEMLFDLEGVGKEAVICVDCDIYCAQCENSVLEREGGTKFIEDGVVWIDGKPFHGDCVAVAVCQEAA